MPIYRSPIFRRIGASIAVLCCVVSLQTFAAEKRVIILGFDGVDPGIVSDMMTSGDLPNLTKLSEQGVFTPLGSSNPPQSPTAWSSFATSKHPGSHGIYDFLVRNPKTYVPGVGFGTVQKPVLNADGSFKTPPAFNNIRKGRTFWKVASNEGVRAKVLSVPFSFPADTLEEGCMISGLGVPDLRGTTSTFFLMSEGYTKSGGLSGGRKIPLDFSSGTATVEVEGIQIPNSRPRKFVSVPISLQVDRNARRVVIDLPEKSLELDEGTWSPWVEWTFDISAKEQAHAISRFRILSAGDEVRLYMTCLQYDPRKQYIEMTSPPEYGQELFDRYGFFKTIGWIYDTHALRQGGLTEDLFLDDIQKTMSWRETLTLDEIDAGDFELLISAWTGTDRVGHMFWHHRDKEHPMFTEEGHSMYGEAVNDTYRNMDRTVGEVMERLEEDDLLMIVSDHGFHSFRKGFNVNTWLIRNGYLAVLGQKDSRSAFNNKTFLRGYDWKNSKAYSIGLGSIFLNLKGREGQGTVSEKQSKKLIVEIRGKLLKVTDPDNGANIFTEIYTRDFYQGKATAGAPDLQLGYAEGYQATKPTAAGAAPKELFAFNTDKWSGDHAASDMATTPGIFFSNIPISKQDPHLVDIGATALTYLGKTVPSDFEGKNLFK
jgi:predicted AlkP superfamily phosphohydrolase/phosphomutase